MHQCSVILQNPCPGRAVRRIGLGGLVVVLAGLSCGPIGGLVDPAEVELRELHLWNRSTGYVVFRVTAAGAEPLVTTVLPPGGEYQGDFEELFGTLCPDTLTIEIFAYTRSQPGVSPLVDETLEPAPYASALTRLEAGRDYGGRADVHIVSLDDTVFCDVLEVDEAEAAIGFDANGYAQVQRGEHASNPPEPAAGEAFPLRGRVVNRNHQPIPNAEVHLLDLGVVIYTDENGLFAVDRPFGSYEIEVVVDAYPVVPASGRFSHRDPDEVPIEFLVQTEDVPDLPGPED